MTSATRRAARLIGCLVLVFLLGPATPARAQSRGGPDDGGSLVALNILYTSDVKGHIEPCG